MYNFTEFTVQLNEMEENVAPTDSRLRPDLRLMEELNIDEADNMMNKLQRKYTAIKRVEPIWFKLINDSLINETMYRFTNEYWTCKLEQDWKKSPDLFSL